MSTSYKRMQTDVCILRLCSSPSQLQNTSQTHIAFHRLETLRCSLHSMHVAASWHFSFILLLHPTDHNLELLFASYSPVLTTLCLLPLLLLLVAGQG